MEIKEIYKAIGRNMKIYRKKKSLTQEELAHKFSKSRSYITNMLGLLNLPEVTIKLVENKELSMGHARALSKLEDENRNTI